MQKQLLKLLVNILSLYIMAAVFSFIEASGITDIIIFSVVLRLMSLLLRPLVLLITLPINMLTFGILGLLVNTWMIMLTDVMVKDVHIPGFWLSFMLAVLIMVFEKIAVRRHGYHIDIKN